jgi:hypothetical protein
MFKRLMLHHYVRLLATLLTLLFVVAAALIATQL